MIRRWLKVLRGFGLGLLRYCPPPILRLLVWWTHAKFLVAVAVVAMRQDQILLLRHRYRSRYPWGLITGFVERGESVEEAAVREIAEETGVQLSSSWRLDCLQMGFVNRRLFEVVYWLDEDNLFPEAVGPSSDGEIEAGVWYSLNRLPRGVPRAQVALIRRAEQTRRTQSSAR